MAGRAGGCFLSVVPGSNVGWRPGWNFRRWQVFWGESVGVRQVIRLYERTVVQVHFLKLVLQKGSNLGG